MNEWRLLLLAVIRMPWTSSLKNRLNLTNELVLLIIVDHTQLRQCIFFESFSAIYTRCHSRWSLGRVRTLRQSKWFSLREKNSWWCIIRNCECFALITVREVTTWWYWTDFAAGTQDGWFYYWFRRNIYEIKKTTTTHCCWIAYKGHRYVRSTRLHLGFSLQPITRFAHWIFAERFVAGWENF